MAGGLCSHSTYMGMLCTSTVLLARRLNITEWSLILVMVCLWDEGSQFLLFVFVLTVQDNCQLQREHKYK
jgi:hypothetical protein